MPTPLPMTIQVDAKTAEILDRLAGLSEHDPAWHVKRAVEAYLHQQVEEYEDIRQAMTEADAGDFATDAEMAETFALFRRGPSLS